MDLMFSLSICCFVSVEMRRTKEFFVNSRTEIIKMFRQPVRISLSDHHSMFISAFTTLLDNGALVDVTLAAEGRSIKAHKVVLSACSSYFKSLFIENPYVHYADLKLIVDFMYYGEVEVPDEQIYARN
ncbi:Protein tramtrack, beta isoform [Pseudolycoriella hygida]|uniref:Protein tramtrack, beta isoform n=1 Tax=Pseudolycoriella hygida TaxID=35572 RepID=A0A9Q0S457_9DIPT|nr:Protein tramtrack, beta isoform [Pseudolycoriella hygida]